MADPAGAEKIDISVEIDAAPNAIRSGPDGTDPGPSRNLRVALLLGPQSADRSVMHSKCPGDIR